jgi:hypothetical protein
MHRINLAAALLVTAVLLAAPSALAATATVVVSQVYAGGGNAGATYQNDFVELFNRGSKGSAQGHCKPCGWGRSERTSWKTCVTTRCSINLRPSPPNLNNCTGCSPATRRPAPRTATRGTDNSES